MELRRLGTSGLRVSALSLGAMLFGASQTNLKEVTSSEEEARRVFDRALEAGITSLTPRTSTLKDAAKS
jgi:aryl-alcohol dehydrogenase-like predicted oxidoreductase